MASFTTRRLSEEPGLEALELRDGEGALRVRVVDELGGWISELVLGGRSWLQRNAWIPLRRRLEVATRATWPARSRYVDRADVGGGDVMLGGCTSETLITPEGDALELVDHGFVWSARPPQVETEVVESEVPALRTTWRIALGARVALLRRTLEPVDETSLRCAFELSSVGQGALPDYWSSHELFPLEASTEYALPLGTPMRVFGSQGAVRLATGGDHRWPHFVLEDGARIDLSRPAEVQRERGDFACKVFTRDEVGAVALHQGAHALELSGSGRVGIWINAGGWVADAVRAEDPTARYLNTCVERTNVPSDRCSEGLALGSARWLHPGERRTWEVHYRAR